MLLLNRKIGLIGAISTLVGTMVGAAVFVLLGPLVNQTGPSLVLAFLLGAIPAFFGSAYYIQLGSMFPSSGGSYIYASRLLSPTFGVLAGLCMIFAGIGAIGMLALGFVNYLGFYFSSLPVLTTALVTVFVFLLINFFGIRFSSLLQVGMVIWMLLALAIYIFVGLFGQLSGDLTAVDNGPFMRGGITGLFMAAVLSFYSYAGYGIITEIGGEIQNPQKNTPRAIVISLILVTLIYMGVSYVSTTIIPIDEFIGFSASIPMTAELFLPNWIVNFIALGGLLAIFTTLNAILLVIPQELYVMGKEGVFSQQFTKQHRRFQSPYISLIAIGFITMFLLITGLSETTFATMTIVGLLLGGVLMGFSALKIFKKAPKLYENSAVKIPKPLLILLSIFGIISSLLFALLAILDVPIVGALVLGIAVIAIVYCKVKDINNNRFGFNEAIDDVQNEVMEEYK